MDVDNGRQDAAPNIDLSIDDDQLLELIKTYEKKFKAKEAELDITSRRERNRKYYKGDQLKERPTKKGQRKISDNVILESQDNVKGIVLSRMPDLVVEKGVGERGRRVAENLTKKIEKSLNSFDLKKQLGRAFDHLPVDFISVLKYRWDPHAGRNGTGDFVIEFIMPENIIFDTSVTEAKEIKMRMIVHKITDRSVKEWVSMFPEKEKEIKDEATIQFKGTKTGENFERELEGFEPTVYEAWFDWFDKDEEFDAVTNPRFNFESGTAWRIGDTLLKKMQNPNWDWEGEPRFFFQGAPVQDEVLAQAINQPELLNQLEEKRVFRNFFKRPRKPFIFMSDRQWGDSPWEMTTSIEQNIPLQDNYDDRVGQISYMLLHARDKHVFAGGIKKKTVEKLDLSDPDQDIVLGTNADLRQIHTTIKGQLPPGEAFADQDRSRNRIMSRVNVNPATRGEVVSNVATTNQIAREGDFTQNDDLAEDTISPTVQEIAEAMIHMIKLRATPEYFEDMVGEESDETHLLLTADDISDGLVVNITASATDKLKAERAAKEEAQLQLIDPINYYKDTGRKDPERRAMMVTIFQISPELYIKKFGQGKDIQAIAQEVQQFSQQRQAQAGAGPQAGFGQGQQVQTAPQNPSPQNTTNVATNPNVI